MRHSSGVTGAGTVKAHCSQSYRRSALSYGVAPLPVAGALAWWDAQQITATADNTAIGTWADKSGNNHALTQATGIDQPVYHSSTSSGLINGHPAVQFTAANTQWMDNVDAGLLVAQPYTIYIVLKMTTTASVQQMVSTGTSTTTIESNTTNFVMSAGTGIAIHAIDTSPHAFVCVYNGASSSWQFDGTNGGTVSAGAASLTTKFRIGLGAGGTQPYNGLVGEAAVWSSALSAGQLGQLHTYAAGKWGTP
jgi:hypothetical protein